MAVHFCFVFLLLAFSSGSAVAAPGSKTSALTPAVPRTKIILDQKNVPLWKSKWDSARILSRERKYPAALTLYRELLSVKPTLDEARFEMAQILIHLGQKQEAIKALEIFLESQPERTDATVALGGLLLGQGMEKRAVDLYLQALEREPGNLKVRLGLGDAYFALKKYGEALEYYDDLVTMHPEDVDLNQKAGMCLESLGRFEKALLYYERICQSKSRDSAFMHRYADCLLSAGNEKEAINVLSSLSKNFPEDMDCHEKLAELYLRKKRDREALPHLKEMLSKTPRDGKLLSRIGQIETELGLHTEAAGTFRTLVEADPRNKEAILRYADALYASGQFKRAVEPYESFLSISRDETVLKKLASIYLKTEKYPEAALKYEELAKAHPSDKEVRQVLLDLYMGLGEKNKALNVVEEILSIDPDRQDMLLKKANLLRDMGRMEESIKAWAKVVETSPDLAGPKVTLARLLAANNQNLAAQHYFSEALQKEENNIDALEGLAGLFELGRDYDRALGLRKKLCELEPDKRQYLQLLTDVQERLCLYDEARKGCRKILELDPGDRDAKCFLASLERLSGNFFPSEMVYRDILAKDPDSEKGRAGLAELYEDRGLSDHAWAEYQKILLKQPGSHSAAEGVVLLLMKGGKAKEADKLIREHMAACSRKGLDSLLLARILIMQNRLNDAREILQKISGDKELRKDSCLALGDLYYRKGQFWNSCLLYNAALAEDKFSSIALIGLQKSAARLQNDPFLKILDFELNKFKQERPDVFLNDSSFEGMPLTRTERISLYSQIKLKHPGNPLSGWYLARALEEDDPKGAARELEDLLGKFDNERARKNLGQSYAARLLFSPAMVQYQRLLAMDPQNLQYKSEKITLLFSNGRGSEAMPLINSDLRPFVDDLLAEQLKKMNPANGESQKFLQRLLKKRDAGSTYRFFEDFSVLLEKGKIPEDMRASLRRVRLDLYGDYIIQKRCLRLGDVFKMMPEK